MYVARRFWPSMKAVERQNQRDIEAPFRPRRAGALIELRPLRWLSVRTEYGMGHAWRVVKAGRYRLWFRVESADRKAR
jgi:hypothetical protein